MVLLETSFAKCCFSIAPEALTGFGGFPAGKAVRARVKDLKVLTMLSKFRRVASSDGSPSPRVAWQVSLAPVVASIPMDLAASARCIRLEA